MRRWPRLLMAGMLVAGVGLYPLLAPPPHRIDQAHLDRITAGMTPEQVEAVFGAPAGEYDWAESDPRGLAALDVYLVALQLEAMANMTESGSRVREFIQTGYLKPVTRTWTSRHGTFVVLFNDQGLVASSAMSPEVRIVPPWQRWWRNWKK